METIAILFGGRSPEYAVSLSSAAAVLSALDRKKYEICQIGITRQGSFLFTTASPDEIARDAWEEKGVPCRISHDPARRGIFLAGGGYVLPDLFLPMLHGGAGEDGRVQGLLSLSGIPYLGSTTEGAAAAMNKASAKILSREAGVPTLPHILFCGDLSHARRGAAALGYPVFVKPTHGGSSVGAGIVRREEELLPALARACEGGDSAIIEPYLSARELEVAVLEDAAGVHLSPVGEVATDGGFYDYETKYQNARARLSFAALDPAQNTRVRTYAEKVYRALGLRHFARIDFFLSRTDGEIYFNEANALPGFTAGSMFPRLFAGEGGLSSLLDRLILAARAE